MKQHTCIGSSFSLWVLALVLSSCGGVMYPGIVPLDRQQQNIYYTAKTPDVPNLVEKNDYSFSLLYGGGDYHDGIDVKGAYSPANHLGVLANYNIYNNHDITYFSSGEIGVGYYTPLASAFNFETYGGFGTTHVKNTHYTGTSNFNEMNTFLQPAIIYHTNDNRFQLALVSKFNLVHFNLRDSSFDNYRESYSASQVSLLTNKPSQVFWEPGIITRTGGKLVFFHVGYTLVRDLTNSELNYSKYHFSLGVHFSLGSEKQKDQMKAD